jgi:hypothetical protein
MDQLTKLSTIVAGFGTGILALLTIFLVRSTMKTNAATVRSQAQQSEVNAATLAELRASAELREFAKRYALWAFRMRTLSRNLDPRNVPSQEQRFLSHAITEEELVQSIHANVLNWKK